MPNPAPSPNLPLTEAPSSTDLADAISELDLKSLVDAFYFAVQADDVIGPVFASHVRDWPTHLAKMVDFWSAVIRRTGRYAGRPIETHARIPELAAEHFDRWLSLWRTTVARTLPNHPPAIHHALIESAERMRASMSSRLLPRQN